MSPIEITQPEARRLILRSQGLDGTWALPPGKEGVAQTVERLAYVQIDTIAVVERAHHHVLWSRHRDYAPSLLDELQACDRRVFEYWWSYGTSYVPMSDYRYYLPRMRAYAESARTDHWLAAHQQVVDEVLERIRQEGPLGAAAFQAPAGFERGTWWNWKPAKEALERLFWAGRLMIAARRGFQRFYDLTERVLPAGTDTSEPSRAEAIRWLVRRATGAQGIVSARGSRWSYGDRREIAQALHELLDAGEIVSVQVAGINKEAYYALPAALNAATSLAPSPRVHLLSPFDNLVIQRAHVQRLFGFDFALECYLPQGKRRYGYFSLPILWGDRFVGRLDPKAERRAGALLVRGMSLEPDTAVDDDFWPALAAELRAYAAFNGCAQVVLEAGIAPDLAAPLGEALRAGG